MGNECQAERSALPFILFPALLDGLWLFLVEPGTPGMEITRTPRFLHDPYLDHHPEIVFHNHTADERAEGADAVREHIAAIFRNNPDLSFVTRSLKCGDDFAVCEWTGSAGGREWDGVDVFPLRDGLILRKDVYSASHRAREIET